MIKLKNISRHEEQGDALPEDEHTERYQGVSKQRPYWHHVNQIFQIEYQHHNSCNNISFK